MTDSDERPETWKPVAPMDGCTFSGYEASDKAQARSVDHGRVTGSCTGKVLAARLDGDGYVLVDLRCDSTDPDHKRRHTFTLAQDHPHNVRPGVPARHGSLPL